MKTPFYRRLSIKNNPLALPLVMYLSQLKERHYQGPFYRGVWMTQTELDEYRWALKSKDSLISTVKFASTSMDRNIAKEFSALSPSTSSDKRSVSCATNIFHSEKN